MNTFEMNLQTSSFDKIKNGTKVIELRLFDDKRKDINLNDIIIFNKESEKKELLKTKVIGLFRYNSFEDLFKDFGPKYFGEKTIEQMIIDVQKFYSKERQKENGVLGIKIEIIK